MSQRIYNIENFVFFCTIRALLMFKNVFQLLQNYSLQFPVRLFSLTARSLNRIEQRNILAITAHLLEKLLHND